MITIYDTFLLIWILGAVGLAGAVVIAAWPRR